MRRANPNPFMPSQVEAGDEIRTTRARSRENRCDLRDLSPEIHLSNAPTKRLGQRPIRPPRPRVHDGVTFVTFRGLPCPALCLFRRRVDSGRSRHPRLSPECSAHGSAIKTLSCTAPAMSCGSRFGPVQQPSPAPRFRQCQGRKMTSAAQPAISSTSAEFSCENSHPETDAR
jgi:hypothetical protein